MGSTSKALAVLPILALSLLLVPQRGAAIPAFSRLYQTSCMTCHIDFPKLNDFGKAFKDAGFKFPKEDEDMLKVAPVMLGAEALKQNFPKSVWPGSIPGMPPIGLRFNTFFQATGANRNQFAVLTPVGNMPQVIPGTDFESGFFSIFTAGNFGSGIAFWVDDDISVGGDNSAGTLGDGYLKFVDAGRFLKLPKDSLSVRVGQFELDLPFTQARSYNLSPYDIYSQANIGAMNSMVALQAKRQQPVHVCQRGEGNRAERRAPKWRLPLLPGRGRSKHLQRRSAREYKSLRALRHRWCERRCRFRLRLQFQELLRALVVSLQSRTRFGKPARGSGRRCYRPARPYVPQRRIVLSVWEVAPTIRRRHCPGESHDLQVQEPYYRTGGDWNFNFRKLNVYGLYMTAV